MKLFSKNHKKYALILSLLVVVCLTIMEVTGNNQSFESGKTLQSIFLMIAPIFVIFAGIFSFRKMSGGAMTWKQGFGEGFKISLLFGIISPFIFLLYYLLVNPSIVASVGDAYQMSDRGVPTIILVDMVVQFGSVIVFGSVVSVFSALILKKKSVMI